MQEDSTTCCAATLSRASLTVAAFRAVAASAIAFSARASRHQPSLQLLSSSDCSTWGLCFNRGSLNGVYKFAEEIPNDLAIISTATRIPDERALFKQPLSLPALIPKQVEQCCATSTRAEVKQTFPDLDRKLPVTANALTCTQTEVQLTSSASRKAGAATATASWVNADEKICFDLQFELGDNDVEETPSVRPPLRSVHP